MWEKRQISLEAALQIIYVCRYSTLKKEKHESLLLVWAAPTDFLPNSAE